MTLVPFYWEEHPDLFAIERAAMDAPGRVIDALDDILPAGLVLDVGAGDGFTAKRLAQGSRATVAMEPVSAMLGRDVSLRIAGDVEKLPFVDAVFDAVYATWAYFFPYFHDPSAGLQETIRVCKPDATIAIVDNLGDDEFSALSDRSIAVEPVWWTERGFELHEVNTVFMFETVEDAQRLLGFYFGDRGREEARLELSYRVGIFTAQAGQVEVTSDSQT